MPQTPSLGLVRAGGLSGALSAVKAMEAERAAAVQLAIKNALAERAMQVDEGGLDVNRGNLGIRAGEFGQQVRQYNEIGKPKGLADIASTQASTASTLGNESRTATDYADAKQLEGLMSNESATPGVVSPQQGLRISRLFKNINPTSPGFTAMTQSPTQAGQAAGTQKATESSSGGLATMKAEERVKADEQIRVNNAREAAQNAGKASPSTAVDDMLDKALATARKLKTMRGKSGAVGARGLAAIPEYFGGKPIPGSDEADFAREAETLVSQISLPNLSMMKGMGALSDMEGKRIEAASTSLSRNTSEPQWDSELDNVIATLTSARERRKPMASHSESATPPQVLAAGPGRHTFANGQTWEVSSDGKTARKVQ